VVGLDVWIWASKFLPPRSFIRMFMENMLAEYPDSDPQLVFLVGCALLGHKVKGDVKFGGNTSLKTTLYVGAVGASASGKSSVISKALRRLGLRALGTRTSPEGLCRVLAERPEEGAIHFADEVHQMFDNASGYLLDVVDVWKTLYNKNDYVLERRNIANSIVVPGNAKLTVFWTTTEEDLEWVLNKISSAWIRRSFIVPVRTQIRFFHPSQEVSWKDVKGLYEALSNLKFRFIIDDPNHELYQLETEMMRRVIPYLSGISNVEIAEKAVRLAAIFALDYTLAVALAKVGREYRVDLLGIEEIKSRVENAIRELAEKGADLTVEYTFMSSVERSICNIFPNLEQCSDGLSEETDFNNSFNNSSTDNQHSFNKSSTRRVNSEAYNPLEGGIRAWCITRVVEKVLNECCMNVERVLNELLNMLSRSNEDTVIRQVLSGELFRITANPQILSTALVTIAIAYALCAPQLPKLEKDGDVIVVKIPPAIVKTAIMFVLANLLSSLRIKGWLGYDPEWGYFLRRLYEIAERNNGVVTLRHLCMYLKRLGKVEVIRSYLVRAIYAGIVEIVSDEENDVSALKSTTPLRVRGIRGE